MTMACTLLKTSLIFLVIHQMRRTAATAAASLSTSYVSSLNTTSSRIDNASNTNIAVVPTVTTTKSAMWTTTNLTMPPLNTSYLIDPSTKANPGSSTTITTTATKTTRPSSTAIKPSATSRNRLKTSSPAGGKTENSDDDSEPKASLYIWEIVACGAGAFVFLLFIIIGILCYQNKTLRKRVKAVGNYSLPIKENGVWIDNQDIPLWQKRASIYNAQGNPAEDNSAQDNPAVEESEAT